MSVPGQPERLEQFSEETRTVIVFPQGAVIRLSATVGPGQMLVVANRKSHQEVLCRVVNVKNHPNVKGYVEIEFTQPTNGFWGVYFPQDAPKPGKEDLSVAMTEGSRGARSVMPMPVSTPGLTSAPMPGSSPVSSVTRSKAPAVPVTPNDFWGSSFPSEVIAPVAPPEPQSPVDEPTPAEASNTAVFTEALSPAEVRIPIHDVALPLPETPPPPAEVVAPRAEDTSVLPPPSLDVASSSVFAAPARPTLEPVVTSNDPWGADSRVELPPVMISSPSLSGNTGIGGSQGVASIAEDVHRPKKDEETIKLAPPAHAAATTEVAPGMHSGPSPSFSTPPDWAELDGTGSSLESSVEDSPLSSVPDLLGAPPEEESLPRVGSASSSSRAMVWIGVAAMILLVVGAAGFFFLHRGSADSTAASANPSVVAATPAPAAVPAPTPSSQPASTPAPTPRTAPAPNDIISAPPQPTPSPVVAKPQSQPPKESKNSTAVAGASNSASSEPPAKRPVWTGSIPKGKLLARASHSAKTNEEDAPPDLASVNSTASAPAIAGVLPGAPNGLPLPPAPANAAPVRVGGRIKEPRLKSKVLPTYPPSARQIGIDGKIVIDAIIDANGNVTNTKVVSGPPLLRRSALDAVRQWKYEPSYLDDKPVAVEMFITVEFHLR